ncbi:hypothetical protein EYF80_035262 [Liparis tanakae]|uniref:Uncharacterized protein n=1 Tax=Liparis tanakae TaxID=230148 RepID=A0A4Z2GML9_9TELE|nr:hypothetical protein EYF80_035262 [Liparis tanakae]
MASSPITEGHHRDSCPLEGGTTPLFTPDDSVVSCDTHKQVDGSLPPTPLRASVSFTDSHHINGNAGYRPGPFLRTYSEPQEDEWRAEMLSSASSSASFPPRVRPAARGRCAGAWLEISFTCATFLDNAATDVLSGGDSVTQRGGVSSIAHLRGIKSEAVLRIPHTCGGWDTHSPTHFETFLLAGWCLRVNVHLSQATLITYRPADIDQPALDFKSAAKSAKAYWHTYALLFPTCRPRDKTTSCILSVTSSCPVAHHGGAVFGLGGLDVLRHRQVDELVLGFRLHHPRALLPHHLDVFRDVEITVQTCSV